MKVLYSKVQKDEIKETKVYEFECFKYYERLELFTCCKIAFETIEKLHYNLEEIREDMMVLRHYPSQTNYYFIIIEK